MRRAYDLPTVIPGLVSRRRPCKLAGEKITSGNRFLCSAMLSRYLKAATCLLIAVACTAPARAQDAAAVAGTYCLTGVREVGSCIRLSPDGKFEYFLAYGAYDENSEGTWRLGGGEVIIDSLAYDKRPGFSFKRTERSGTDAFDVIVESKSGQSIAGIDVSVTCDGRTRPSGMTQADGFGIECVSAPTAVALGLPMYDLAPQTIDVSGRAGADRAYVFEFDPGDMGKKKFVAQRLRIDGDELEMSYADTPIRELQGQPFRYVRER